MDPGSDIDAMNVGNQTETGTRTSKDEEGSVHDNCWVISIETCISDLAWPAIQKDKPSRRLRRRMMGRMARDSAFDPAEWDHLDRDCYFACTYWCLKGQVPGKRAIAWTRWRYIQAWRSAEKTHDKEQEDNGGTTYVRTYVVDGEAFPSYVHMRSYPGKSCMFSMVITSSSMWWVMQLLEHVPIEYWRFHEQHYSVIERMDNGFSWAEAGHIIEYGRSHG